MSNSNTPHATAYTADGQPIIVNVQVGNEGTAARAPVSSAPASSASAGVMQPKVAHLNEPEAPLNVENPRGASETTASLANLTTGLAGMVLTAPAAAFEKVAPVLSEKLTVAGQAAAVHAQNAGSFVVQKAQGAAATTSSAASSAATTVQDTTVNAAFSVQQGTVSAASTVQQSTANAAGVVQDKATAAGQALPSSTAEAGAQAQSLLAQAASYLPTSIQSVLPESITGSHSTLGTKDSPLAPYTTPVANKAADTTARAQEVASSIGTKDSPLAPYTTPVVNKANEVASKAERATDTTTVESPHNIPARPIDSGIHDLGRDTASTNVVGAGQINTPTPYSTNSASSAAQLEASRHRESANFASSDSKVEQAKHALSNTAFEGDRAGTDSNKYYTQQAADALSSNKTASSGHGLTDVGRQSATDRFSSAAKPDSQKTYTEIAADTVKGKADDLASYVQPDSNKSFGQSIADTVGTKKQT